MKKFTRLCWTAVLAIGLSMPGWAQNTTGNTTQSPPAKKETKEQRKARKDAERAKKKADRDAKKQQTSKNK
jgi:hypothetical protein